MKKNFLATIIVLTFLTSAGFVWGVKSNSFQQVKDRGIGPVKNVELGPLDKKMVDVGKSLFNNKCTVCHDMDQLKVGPPLKNVTKDRTPEFIMNLLLNSVQMQNENTTVKNLLKKYNNIPMPDPGITQKQARSILEYLRSVAK